MNSTRPTPRNRTELIAELHIKRKHPLDEAVEMAQRLFDRIIFIAFCEDRQLLPEKTIPKAYTVAGFHAVTNPRWQQFKNLFRFIDEGNETYGIPRYNGGLFAPHRGRRTGIARRALDELLQHDRQVRFRRRSQPRRAGAPVRAVDHGIGEAQGVGLVRRRGKGEPIRLDAAVGQAEAAWHLLHAAGVDEPDRAVHGRGIDCRAVRGRGRRVRDFREGGEPRHRPGRRRLLASMPGHLAEPQDRRSGLRQRGVPVPSLRRAGSPLPRSHRPPGPVGRAGREEARRADSDVHPAGESLRRRSLARGGRDHATGPLDSLGQSGPTAGQDSRRTSSTATRWFTTRRSTRPVSIGASGSPTSFEPRGSRVSIA